MMVPKHVAQSIITKLPRYYHRKQTKKTVATVFELCAGLSLFVFHLFRFHCVLVTQKWVMFYDNPPVRSFGPENLAEFAVVCA